MSLHSSQKVHNGLRILLHGFSRLKVERKESNMEKIVRNIAKKIADYLKEIIDDELTVMDAFYRQFA